MLNYQAQFTITFIDSSFRIHRNDFFLNKFMIKQIESSLQFISNQVQFRIIKNKLSFCKEINLLRNIVKSRLKSILSVIKKFITPTKYVFVCTQFSKGFCLVNHFLKLCLSSKWTKILFHKLFLSVKINLYYQNKYNILSLTSKKSIISQQLNTQALRTKRLNSLDLGMIKSAPLYNKINKHNY